LLITADSVAPGGFIELQNVGFFGINVVDQTEYKFSFYTKCSNDFKGAITVALVSADGLTQYA
jgi:hypothetical protein